MKILILSNSGSGLVNFRLELIQRLIDSEFIVYISVPEDKYSRELNKIGCRIINTNLSRHGKNPFKELKLIRFYKRLLKTIQPDCVLTYTIKPNVYGGIACQKISIPYIANITGLGDSIENGGLLQKISFFLYKKGLKKAYHVFFQNESNCSLMLKHKLVCGSYSILPGSGVDLKKHNILEYPSEDRQISFVTIGRITKDKGINELLSAIKAIKRGFPNVTFLVIGYYDNDAYKEIIQQYENDGLLKHIDFTDDVNSYLVNAFAIIHPSYHEGMSNVLLEAAACGRPVLASDIPGCKETFDDGVSGISFKAKDTDSLINAIRSFIALPYKQKKEMGMNARKKVEKEFDRNIVVDKYLQAIGKVKQGDTKK